ncbi:Arc family DNA-binding protein [Pusillimonas sp.]|uniref:Arc family DNA-binding protein n=1 Tax=Pusillimonas sp. TaxID=3040095 RepID=UPI0037C70806
MATQDDYIKTALRLPRQLHGQLLASAQQTGKSMNAEILTRLAASFEAKEDAPKSQLSSLEARQESLQKIVEGLQETVQRFAQQSARK